LQLHPWLQQKAVVKYCEDNGIVIEAYCPIVRNQKANDATLAPIAKELGLNPNQVLLRYCLQKNWIPLPKSDDPGRMKMNADLYSFELSPKQMAALDACDAGDAGAVCPENLPHTIP
jgi:diketogulonate reductase-like aldo/keto reductase